MMSSLCHILLGLTDSFRRHRVFVEGHILTDSALNYIIDIFHKIGTNWPCGVESVRDVF